MYKIFTYPLILAFLLGLVACGESIEATKVEGHKKKAYEQNPTDAVGVAEGDKQVSPFGKPAY